MSIMVGVGRGAQSGVLIRDAEALERMEKVNTLVVDKTGTLTEGKPKVVSMRTASGWAENDLLRLAASLERSSEHPLGAAIIAAANERGLQLASAQNFESPVGKGIVGTVEGKRLVIGNRRILADAGIAAGWLDAEADALRQDGATVVHVAIDGAVAGLIAIADPIKPSAPKAIDALKRDGIRIVMLTGDNATTAQAVARLLGIAEVEAEVLPQDKSRVVERLRKEGQVVAMAGDGINDAPALAAADIGIAMGGGTDVAMHAAGITLMRGDPRLVPAALEISRKTYAKIRQNLFWAFVYNLIGIPLAVLGVLNPVLAGAAMALSSVSVVSNALLLKTWKPKDLEDNR
jgi:Cu+-exporting ATPase